MEQELIGIQPQYSSTSGSVTNSNQLIDKFQGLVTESKEIRSLEPLDLGMWDDPAVTHQRGTFWHILARQNMIQTSIVKQNMYVSQTYTNLVQFLSNNSLSASLCQSQTT